MPGYAVAVLLLLLVGAVVGGSIAIGAPLLALPIVALVLVVWGGARVATRRGLGVDEQ